MVEHSVLQPRAEALPTWEKEDAAPWIVRKLVGVSNHMPLYGCETGTMLKTMKSLTGRIVMASFETLRATGTSVICLSPVCLFNLECAHRYADMPYRLKSGVIPPLYFCLAFDSAI